MDEEQFHKYGEIRNIASRQWLKPASVSLARLDQIKARVYNLSFAERKALHANSKNRVTGDDPPEPPLSGIASQNHAWGSNTSIPDLIKQQSERQKLRPASAKLTRPRRPTSGKKARPHSAKGSLVPQDLPKGQHGHKNGVPPTQGLGLQGNGSGCVAPPRGITETESQINQTIEHFIEGQFMGYGNGTCVDNSGIPPPPRCSPDFLRMLDANYSDVAQAGSDGDAYNYLHEEHQNNPNVDHPEKPMPESIMFSLPTAGEDVDDCDLDVISSVNDKDASFKYTSINNPTPKEMFNLDGKHFSVNIIKEDPEDVESQMSHQLKEEYQMQQNSCTCTGQIAIHNKMHNVIFDEEKNVTVDITPRPKRVQSAKSRPYSGRSDLRNVKSRIDTGVTLASTRHSKQLLCRNGEVDGPDSDGCDERKHFEPQKMRNIIANKSKTAACKVSTVTVNYVDDEGQDSDGGSTKKVERKKPKHKDVVSQMSKLNLSDDGLSDIDGRPVSRSSGGYTSDPEASISSPSKRLSSTVKNYYELSKHNNFKPCVASDDEDEKVQRMKTTKTIMFSNGHVSETKDLSVIDALAHSSSSYIPPRPPSASKPQMSTRPTSAKQRTTNPLIATKRVPASQINKPPLPPTSNTKRNSVPEVVLKDDTVDTDLPERPESRMGFRDQMPSDDNCSDENKPPSHQKRRRVVSAPMVRSHDPCGRRIPEASRRQGRPTSAKLTAQGSNLHSKSHCRLYSKSTSAIMKSSGRRAKQPKAYKSAEVVEIWTRKEDFEFESEGMKECKQIQDKLIEAGVPVALETLKRALLPPTEYGFSGNTIKTTCYPVLPPNYTNGLISKPELWLKEEYRRLQQAKKKVREANAAMLNQELEARRKALSAEAGPSSETKKKAKKSVKYAKVHRSKSAK